MAKILLAEDDEDVAASIADALTLSAYVVESVHNGNEAADRLRLYDYDLAILDWDLPGKDGVQLLKEYRTSGGKLPILMLTGKVDIEHRIEGLDSGADDYLGKPFSMGEVLARVRSLLRRPHQVLSEELKIGDLTVLPAKSAVLRDGIEISLLAKEMQLLDFLTRHRGQCFTAQELLNKVWHSESDSTEDAVRQCLLRLRRKIDKPGEDSIIKTLRNVGYMIES
ncbi:response regulator transcription factor [Candidatus Obscuribacterales bacterium]|nr:response regulator transcription factor [Candidatus Obscuribacterales bacterium]MBX3152942.1 response regulator transcription factor [Candidatus Obscuribacterales bacterium]